MNVILEPSNHITKWSKMQEIAGNT